MGVNIAHYVVAGVKLPYEKYEYEQLEKFMVSYWEPKKALKFGVLYDGMSGDYIIAGQILAATGNDRDFFEDGPVTLKFDAEKIKKDLKEKIGVEAKEIKLFAVTHHT